MKKTLLALSVLALMTACSSADEERMEALDTKLGTMETINMENMDALSEVNLDEARVAELEKRAKAANTFVNPKSVFGKSGIEIVEKDGVATLVLPNAITFDLNSAEIKPEFVEILDALSDALMDYPDGKIKIEGHTDNTGTPEYNKGLSEERAEAAKAYLLDKGIEEDRIDTEGLGEAKARYSNEDAEGRMKNRRIEVLLYK